MKEEPIDPDVIRLLSEPGPGPSEPVPAPVAAKDLAADVLRQGMRDAIEVFTRGADPIAVHHVRDELAAGRVPVRLYGPEDPAAVLLYLHGGAWVAGGLDTHDLITRRLSRDTGALVVAVDYRMLPEHAFPAPLHDAYDAAGWASALRPDLPFLIAGDSAGGTLAACTALRARDEGGPRIDAQVLVYAAMDDDFDAPSMLAFDGPHLTRDDIRFYIEQYAASDAAVGSPYALPDRAASLTGLPPAVVVIAGHDLLRSGAERYAQRLRDDGVPVTVQLDLDLVHGWLEFAARVRAADRAFTRLTDTINALIADVHAPAAR
jgi:acetyl esterase